MDRLRVLKIIETVAITMAIVAVVWGVIVASKLENPAYNPQLRLPLMIGAGACAFWMAVLFAREAKEFGWGQVIISVVALIVVQVIVFFLFR